METPIEPHAGLHLGFLGGRHVHLPGPAVVAGAQVLALVELATPAVQPRLQQNRRRTPKLPRTSGPLSSRRSSSCCRNCWAASRSRCRVRLAWGRRMQRGYPQAGTRHRSWICQHPKPEPAGESPVPDGPSPRGISAQCGTPGLRGVPPARWPCPAQSFRRPPGPGTMHLSGSLHLKRHSEWETWRPPARTGLGLPSCLPRSHAVGYPSK